MKRSLAFFLILLLAHSTRAVFSNHSDLSDRAWRDAATGAGEAHEEFSVLLRRKPVDVRALRLGRALTLLSRQPVGAASLQDARTVFQELAKVPDDPGLAARYFLARLAQDYQDPADFAAAATGYRDLIDSCGATFWGQLALAKLAILRLYVLPAAGPAERIAAVEGLLRLANPVTARDLHLLLADAQLYYGLGEGAALKNLLSAKELDRGEGRLAAGRRSDLLVQITDLSARLGLLGQARACAQELAQEFPRDWRLYPVRQILAAAEAGRPGPVP